MPSRSIHSGDPTNAQVFDAFKAANPADAKKWSELVKAGQNNEANRLTQKEANKGSSKFDFGDRNRLNAFGLRQSTIYGLVASKGASKSAGNRAIKSLAGAKSSGQVSNLELLQRANFGRGPGGSLVRRGINSLEDYTDFSSTTGEQKITQGVSGEVAQGELTRREANRVSQIVKNFQDTKFLAEHGLTSDQYLDKNNSIANLVGNAGLSLKGFHF